MWELRDQATCLCATLKVIIISTCKDGRRPRYRDARYTWYFVSRKKNSNWCILQKLRWVKFFYRIFLMKMVKYPQTYPLIPKKPLGWSIKSKFWRIFKCTFMYVKYVVQRFVPRDLIFWSFAYCLTISESSCQPGSTGTQIWAQNSKKWGL